MPGKEVLELTLAILKPNVCAIPHVTKEIHGLILTSHFKFVRARMGTLPLFDLEKFYGEHKGKFFYNRLMTFMQSGPSQVFVLAADNAINRWRALAGPTRVYQANYEAPESIRGRFGLSDTRNAVHGSDSPTSAKREINIMFPDFDINEWYANEEHDFRKGNVQFDPEKMVHEPLREKQAKR